MTEDGIRDLRDHLSRYLERDQPGHEQGCGHDDDRDQAPDDPTPLWVRDEEQAAAYTERTGPDRTGPDHPWDDPRAATDAQRPTRSD